MPPSMLLVPLLFAPVFRRLLTPLRIFALLFSGLLTVMRLLPVSHHARMVIAVKVDDGMSEHAALENKSRRENYNCLYKNRHGYLHKIPESKKAL